MLSASSDDLLIVLIFVGTSHIVCRAGSVHLPHPAATHRFAAVCMAGRRYQL